MVCPQDVGGGGGGGGGGGIGQPTENLTFSGFQISITPSFGLHYKSDFHPWGPQTLHSTFNYMISTYNKFITALLQRVKVFVSK